MAGLARAAVPAGMGRPAPWQLFLLVGAVACALYAFVPPFQGNGILFSAFTLAGTIAIAVAARVHRPATRLPWYLFSLGLALFFLGDVYTQTYPHLVGGEVPFPSLGDGFYTMVYPALVVGLLMLVRRRNPQTDRSSLIDALILTLGAALLSWVFLIAPQVHDNSMTLFQRLASIAYPLGDILLLAVAIRLAVDSGRRAPAFYFLSASIVALLATDSAYTWALLEGTYTGQLWLDAGWIAFYLLWGAGALHPSMRTLEEPTLGGEARLTRVRLALLTAASLIAPGVQMSQELDTGASDMVVIILASVLLFLLVVARMVGLVRQQERSAARERALRTAGAALVAASGRDEIHAAALEATLTLAGPCSHARLCLLEGDPGVVVGGDAGTGPLSRAAAAALRLRAGLAGGELGGREREELGLPAGLGTTIVLPLTVRDEVAAVLVAATAERGRGLAGALTSLATHISLALESAVLTEDLLRRESEARFRSLVQHASDLITVLAPDGTITYQSPSIRRVLGYAPEDAVGMRFDDLLEPNDRAHLARTLDDRGGRDGQQLVECKLLHRDGGWVHFEILHTNLLHDESVGGVVLNGRDVSERKAFEQQLSHQAFHDPITNLANRALFADRVEHALARGGREGRGLAVIFLDLDDFKTINDSLGHAAGDHVLVAVADRLRAAIRPSDTAARFGGDEFAILLEQVEDAEAAIEVAERVLEALQAPVEHDSSQLVVRASIGIALAGLGGGSSADELIRNADVAMYISKRDGKGGVQLFEPRMHEQALERLELRADLQHAIEAGDEFEVHFQPVVRLGDGRPAGVEALLRWRHPTRGLVSPEHFIGFAEEMNLIVPIGQWVLREACRHGAELQARFPSDPPISVSVNLSVKQLQHGDIVADVREALADSGLVPWSLVLEITESVMMADADLAVRRLGELKELGVRLAMDDFGTGYSSLSYLSRFPVDLLKMDRSFLRNGATADPAGLAAAVVALGETLNLPIVAEGVELTPQLESLRAIGCDLGQGFLFARPMPLDATLDYFEREHRGGAEARRADAA
jgi:diguanylate cyclase (GGDEF)-like protein/PAS domain S-box-containing protein